MKGGKSRDVVRTPLFVPRREEHAERAVRAPRPLHDSEKILDVLPRHPPVPEHAQGGNIALVPRLEELRGPRPKRREDACDRSLNGRDAAEGEGRGEEGNDLAIRRIPELMGEDERVRIEAAGAPLPPQRLEALPEEGEISWAARAPSHLPTLASPP